MERLAGKVILLWGWRQALAAFLAGALAAFGQPPYDFFAVCFVSFPLLVWLLDGAAAAPGAGLFRRAAGAFGIGWWFGFGYFLAGLWWTGNALLVQADLFAWALPFALFGLPAVLAVFYGAATVIARLLWSDHLGRLAALAFGFGVAEWLRGFLLTGFPWIPIGGAAMPVPAMMQSLGVIGMIGVNALAVFVFATPALLASGRGRFAGFGLAILLVAAHLGYGYWRLASADPDPRTLFDVRIVQPSILQSDKWDRAEQDRIFGAYIELSQRPPAEGAAPPRLIVWPETAVPFLFADRPDALVALGEMVDDGQILLAGVVRTEAAGSGTAARYYNSVVAINSAGVTYDAVDKTHLVPFGEYIPFAGLLDNFGVGRLAQSVAPFSAGAERHAIDTVDGVGVLPFICYEIIFPGLVASAGTQADLLLNVTNDAWFGDTPGPYQHFRQAQFRAVEAGLPVVRAANNGISAVIDAYGRVIDGYAVDAVGVLDVAVPRQRLERAVPFAPAAIGAGLLAALGLLALAARIYSTFRKY